MSQTGFSDVEYAGKRKKNGREVYLAQMKPVVPNGATEGHRAVLRCRESWPTPYPRESMLHMHLMQHWFVLSDFATEEALNDRFAATLREPEAERADLKLPK